MSATVAPPDHTEPELNVTPLIDVLLVLLTMLILTVPILTHAVKIDLPLGTSAKPRPSVDLDIDFDGRVFWNGTAVSSQAELERWLAQLRNENPQPDVKIWPDRRGRYERVAQVMAAAQRSGVTQLSIAPVAH